MMRNAEIGAALINVIIIHNTLSLIFDIYTEYTEGGGTKKKCQAKSANEFAAWDTFSTKFAPVQVLFP